MATRSILIALILTVCVCGLALAFKTQPPGTPSGFPLKHPGEVHALWDVCGCYRAILPDGSEEVICFNGTRRPLLALRMLFVTPRAPEGLKFAAAVRSLPSGFFPVVVTSDESGVDLRVISIPTGEVLDQMPSDSTSRASTVVQVAGSSL